jgi:hypothetical protein
MPAYANLGGNSSVVSYDDSDPESIVVTFASGRWRNYEYNAASCGAANVARLKELARAGKGLNSFIGKVVKQGYARRW